MKNYRELILNKIKNDKTTAEWAWDQFNIDEELINNMSDEELVSISDILDSILD